MATSKKTITRASKTPAKKAERPRIKSSHGSVTSKTETKRGATKAGAGSRTSVARPAAARKASGAGRAGGAAKSAKPAVRLRTGAARPALPKLKTPKGPPIRSLGPSSMASDASREIATAIAVAAMDKKAVGLEILDVAGKVDYADFLVIMTGRSDRQVQALAFGIEEALKRKGVRLLAVEGMQQAAWVLMDYGDVVVHVFQDEARSLYDIEGLWMDALRLPVPAPAQS